MKNKKKMPLKARKFLKVWVTAVLVIFVVGAMALTCFAAEDDPITVVTRFEKQKAAESLTLYSGLSARSV